VCLNITTLTDDGPGASLITGVLLVTHLVELVEKGDCALVSLRQPLILLPERLRVELLCVLQLFLHAVVRNKLTLVQLEHRSQREAMHPYAPHEVDHIK